MFDLVSVGIGAAIMSVGYVLGAITFERKNTRPKAPTCGCDHVISMHEANNGRCLAEVDRQTYDPQTGFDLGTQYVPCPCQRYVGPELLTDVWAPGVTTYGAELPSGQQKKD